MEDDNGKVYSISLAVMHYTSRPTSRKSHILRFLQIFIFVFLCLSSWTAVAGSSEGRFQQTSLPDTFVFSGVDKYLGQHSAANGNILDRVDLVKSTHDSTVGGTFTKESEIPVLNLTVASARFANSLENDPLVMGLNFWETDNSPRKRSIVENSDEPSKYRKHKGLKEYLKDRISSEPRKISLDENWQSREAIDTGSKRLSILKNLKSFTRNPLGTKPPFNFGSSGEGNKTLHAGIESSTERTSEDNLDSKLPNSNDENLSVEPGGKSMKNMLGMLKNLKKSTAIPRSELSNAITYRPRNVPEVTTAKPKVGLSSALRKFLKEGVRSSKINLREVSSIEDSIDQLPENKTANISNVSVHSPFSYDNNVSTLTPTANFNIENKSTSPIKSRVVDLAEIEEIDDASGSSVQNVTTSIPVVKINDETFPQSNSPPVSTEETSMTTVSTSPRKVVIISKFKTFQQPESTSPTVKQSEQLPLTEAWKIQSLPPARKQVSTTETSEFRKSTIELADETLTDVKTNPNSLDVPTTKVPTSPRLITDDKWWDKDSTSTPETPHVGHIVEKELLTVYTDTAGITVCLVFLCIGLLLVVFAIYFFCLSSKARDSDNNVEPYSARRFSDA